ncbi:MAG: pyridoxamine 5'-phosphate oxidase family protein [Clostridia bacterium]|nr:pyridoxamine 5'-phosphate oxidase family protein [Clostridia bacterium]
MNEFERVRLIMDRVFSCDMIFAFATCVNDIPSVRCVDACYYEGRFYIVTYASTNKVRQITENPRAAMTNKQMHSFSGLARNIGHPLKPQNSEIRNALIPVFADWYFQHNDEGDDDMCYIEFEPQTGFVHDGGMGYRVDFENRTAVGFPFESQIIDPQA